MRELVQGQLLEALDALGIRSGDGLLVHSALHFLGRPAGGGAAGLEMVLQTFDQVLGLGMGSLDETSAAGTLAVPAFNFGFARGQAYDPQTTPAQGMGAFSEFVRQQQQARRTLHPMQSLAVIGLHAADLAGRDTPSAFDPGSAFERMLELDFKLLLLGADIQAVSMLHYSEQRLGVPYRYWKDFTGQVRVSSGPETDESLPGANSSNAEQGSGAGPGTWQIRTYRMYVRDLQLDPHIQLRPVQDELERLGLWRSERLNYGRIHTCRLVDFVDVLDGFLRRDPWSLVTNPPQAHPGAGTTENQKGEAV